MQTMIKADDGDLVTVHADDLSIEQLTIRLELESPAYGNGEFDQITLTTRSARELGAALIQAAELVKASLTEHDHQGRFFQLPEQAQRQGELIAIDLQFASEEWAGGQVSVRDVQGRELYSIPVLGEE